MATKRTHSATKHSATKHSATKHSATKHSATKHSATKKVKHTYTPEIDMYGWMLDMCKHGMCEDDECGVAESIFTCEYKECDGFMFKGMDTPSTVLQPFSDGYIDVALVKKHIKFIRDTYKVHDGPHYPNESCKKDLCKNFEQALEDYKQWCAKRGKEP
jgi:hypothetical protein